MFPSDEPRRINYRASWKAPGPHGYFRPRQSVIPSKATLPPPPLPPTPPPYPLVPSLPLWDAEHRTKCFWRAGSQARMPTVLEHDTRTLSCKFLKLKWGVKKAKGVFFPTASVVVTGVPLCFSFSFFLFGTRRKKQITKTAFARS